MERVGKLRGSLLVALAVAVGLTVTLLLITRSGSASGAKPLVKTAQNAALGKTILVTGSGLTLYSLSAERHGRFICTSAFCLSLWKPLVVARGVKPTGVSGLTVVKRPDAKRQVAFRGAPLYRFVQDTKPGQVKGNGFKDVGVWRVVTVGGSAAPVMSPGGGYGGYGGYGG
jgi:predicted lipoprotein with Yx(FWY)xxD motif